MLYENLRLSKRMNKCGKNLRIEGPSYIQGEQFMSVGDDFLAKPGLRIDCLKSFNGVAYTPKLTIGNHVLINYHCHIGVINEVFIGNDVLFGSRILVTDHSHGEFDRECANMAYLKRPLVSKGPVRIEDNVWIGENACILPGVTIGKGCIIGANSVVTKDIPPYSIVVGIPARVIRQLEFD